MRASKVSGTPSQLQKLCSSDVRPVTDTEASWERVVGCKRELGGPGDVGCATDFVDHTCAAIEVDLSLDTSKVTGAEDALVCEALTYLEVPARESLSHPR